MTPISIPHLRELHAQYYRLSELGGFGRVDREQTEHLLFNSLGPLLDELENLRAERDALKAGVERGIAMARENTRLRAMLTDIEAIVNYLVARTERLKSLAAAALAKPEGET